MIDNLKFIKITVGPLETNCYLVYHKDTRETIIVDPGAEPERISKIIKENRLIPTKIVNTHGHIDHIGGNRYLKEKFKTSILIHYQDIKTMNSAGNKSMALILGTKPSPEPDEYLSHDDRIYINNNYLEVIHTPGHTPGSICLKSHLFLLTGDTLFCGSVGRTDLPGGSWKELIKSIKEKILTLNDDLEILPGHGLVSTLREEKNYNPFLK
ncbi:MAG: MBL fold metallo-hydrolase [Acidobacteriota bacterium]